MVRIELLYFDGCPGYEAVAREERFLGSPTLRVDGVDVEPGARDRRDYGLKCRLYRTADGLLDAPPDEWVRDALCG